jgi:hypothetical protein
LFGLLKFIYTEVRKNEIEKASIMIKKLKTDHVFNSITKSCWKYDIQYETVIKNGEILELKLRGRKEAVLIRFHKVDKVFLEDYQRFTTNMEVHGVKRGIYITTGDFEDCIMKHYKKGIPFFRPIKLVNSFDLIKSRLGLHGSAGDVLRCKKIKFFRYLPM